MKLRKCHSDKTKTKYRKIQLKNHETEMDSPAKPERAVIEFASSLMHKYEKKHIRL